MALTKTKRPTVEQNEGHGKAWLSHDRMSDDSIKNTGKPT